MTTSERAVLSGELAEVRLEILEELRAIRAEQMAARSRLDRLDGAITFIKAATGFLGLGGLTLILAALINATGRAL